MIPRDRAARAASLTGRDLEGFCPAGFGGADSVSCYPLGKETDLGNRGYRGNVYSEDFGDYGELRTVLKACGDISVVLAGRVWPVTLLRCRPVLDSQSQTVKAWLLSSSRALSAGRGKLPTLTAWPACLLRVVFSPESSARLGAQPAWERLASSECLAVSWSAWFTRSAWLPRNAWLSQSA